MDKLNDLLIQIYKVQYTLNESLFYQIFPFNAKYLWQKFSQTYKYNLIEFYNSLDKENRELLCEYIRKHLSE